MHLATLLRRVAPAMALLVTVSWPATAQDGPAQGIPPAEFGERFPASALENLNEGIGGASTVDLGRVLGKRPVVLYYWIAGNQRSETVFQELQELAGELGPQKLLLYGLVTERPGLGAERIVERMRALKIHVPVLNDRGFELGQRLQIHHVPSISILDLEGNLRLANAGSLRQILEYKMNVEDAMRRVATTGKLGTYGSLPRWYPVQELVGQKCPDFDAPLLFDGGVRRWSKMIDPEKMNVLVFWSVDCPHCRESLPELNQWLKKNSDGINLVSAAKVLNETVRVKTEEFCRLHDLVFPTFIDEGRKIGEMFMVISTPTFLIIRPDGVIDSVILSGLENLEKTLEAKKKELVGSSKTSGS